MTLAVVLGALAACLVAWTAIAGFAALGRVQLRLGPVRVLGGAALAVLALRVAGAPLPWALAPALLGVGLVVGAVSPIVDEATA